MTTRQFMWYSAAVLVITEAAIIGWFLWEVWHG